MDQERQSSQPKNLPVAGRRREPAPASGIDDFIRRLKSERNTTKPNQDKVAAALDAVQRMALQMDTGEAMAAVSEALGRHLCHACGTQNPRENRFCAKCGVPQQDVPAGDAPAPSDVQLMNPLAPAPGQHHYHHHYHHHYFASEGAPPGAAIEPRAVGASSAIREATRARGAATPGFNRTEAAVRKLAQDWALACNTKRLDDLVDLYAADATVLRSNLPPVRSAAAIRELFFTVLEAGLGDVEMETLRVEVFGEIAYEVGRYTMLVPTAMGKRREERGKYMILAARQAGEWKILVDCWSSDLSLAEAGAGKPNVSPAKSA